MGRTGRYEYVWNTAPKRFESLKNAEIPEDTAKNELQRRRFSGYALCRGLSRVFEIYGILRGKDIIVIDFGKHNAERRHGGQRAHWSITCYWMLRKNAKGGCVTNSCMIGLGHPVETVKQPWMSANA